MPVAGSQSFASDPGVAWGVGVVHDLSGGENRRVDADDRPGLGRQPLTHNFRRIVNLYPDLVRSTVADLRGENQEPCDDRRG